jgi:hypothetical protein
VVQKVPSNCKDSKRKIPEQTEFEVDKIVSHWKDHKGKYQFLTKWEGCTCDENTWEDANEKVKEIPLLVQKYLSTIDNKELLASLELQKIYDESIGLAQLETGENGNANNNNASREKNNNTANSTDSSTKQPTEIPLMMSTGNIMKQPTEVQLMMSRAHELDTERCDHRDHSKLESFMQESDPRVYNKGNTVMERYLQLSNNSNISICRSGAVSSSMSLASSLIIACCQTSSAAAL